MGRALEIGDHAPIPEHRHRVADRLDLPQVVRHVQNADAATREPLNRLEQQRRLVRRERRGRLVEDDETCVEGERARDHHEPLLDERQLADRRIEWHVERDGLERLRGAPAQLSVPYQPYSAAGLVPEHDVGRDGQRGRDCQLLWHRGDAGAEGVDRTSELQRSPAYVHRAVRRANHPGEALDERRLACAVGANEAVHLARPNGEGGSVEREHAAIALREPIGTKPRRACLSGQAHLSFARRSPRRRRAARAPGRAPPSRTAGSSS